MGLIDISKIMIVKPINLDSFLIDIGSNLTTADPNYAITLLLANIFAYLFIILFMFCIFIVLRNVKRRIRRIFS